MMKLLKVQHKHLALDVLKVAGLNNLIKFLNF